MRLRGRLRSSPAVGGAEGEVRYGRTQDDDVVIDLTVEHLRAPERLEPPGWAYVAWARGSSGSPLNLGPLSVSRGRHATLRAVTQLRNFDLFVTAEPAADVESPSGEPLLWASRHE
ncbi:MAG: hypothetical protein M0D55_05445 [Elusimicrobiota bacterium]|nr:MAG: hypothetical protein M0D55_05445 [Elusimicrobiota bacterium]